MIVLGGRLGDQCCCGRCTERDQIFQRQHRFQTELTQSRTAAHSFIHCSPLSAVYVTRPYTSTFVGRERLVQLERYNIDSHQYKRDSYHLLSLLAPWGRLSPIGR